MLKPFIVYYQYKSPGTKKTGAVKQFRLYADSVEQARVLAARQAGYPNIKVLDVSAA